MNKNITLTRKEEEWIRREIAVSLESNSNPIINDAQDDVWNDKKFNFDKNRFSEEDIEELEICKGLFNKLRNQPK